MIIRSKLFATAAVVAIIAAPISHAVAQVPSPAAKSTQSLNADLPRLLDQAATDAEHFAETAIARDDKQASTHLVLLKGKLQMLRPQLAPGTATAIDIQVRRADHALNSADFKSAALAGAETYRILQDSIDIKVRQVPLEVSLLDYSGFKIEALSRATIVDWPQVQSAQSEALGFWLRLEPKVASKGLKSTMATIFDGLSIGIEHRAHRQVTFVARMLLDSVDLLEGPLSNATKVN